MGRAEGPLEICGDELREHLEWLHVVLQLCMRIVALGHGEGGELDMIKVGMLLGKYDGGDKRSEGVGTEYAREWSDPGAHPRNPTWVKGKARTWGW